MSRFLRPRFIRNAGDVAVPDGGCSGSPSETCACLERLYELITAPHEPTLCWAELFTWSDASGVGKLPEYGIYITVKTANYKTLIASANNVESGYGFRYNPNSAHTVPLVIDAPGVSRADCDGFKVRMQLKTQPPIAPWAINLARVALYFSDGTTLVAEQLNFALTGQEHTIPNGSEFVETEFASR